MSVTNDQAIGLRIVVLRRLRGMNGRQLAKAACIQPADLSKIEHGKQSLGPAWRSRIALALGVSEDELR